MSSGREHDAAWESVGDPSFTWDDLPHGGGCPECRRVRRFGAALGMLRQEWESGRTRCAGDVLARVLAPRPPSQTAVRVSGPHAGRRVCRRRGRTRIASALVITLVFSAALVGLNGRERGGVAEARVLQQVFSPDCPSRAKDGTERVHVVGTWAGEEKRRFRAVLDGFRRRGLEVLFETKSEEPDRDFATTLQARIDRGCPPDVAMLTEPGLLRKLIGEGVIKPLPKSVRDLVQRNYSQFWQQQASADGRLYGVWFKAANKSVFWHRAGLFDHAPGPPRTWSELLAAAAAMSASDVTPLSIAGGDGWTLTDWFENVYLQTAGTHRYDQLARHDIPWTDPTVVTALSVLGQVFSQPGWMAGGPARALVTTYEESVGLVFGDPPSAAMVYEADYVANLIPPHLAVDQGARAFPFPAIDASTPAPTLVGGDVAVLFNPTDAAVDLMKYLATPEAARPWAELGGFSSPNRAFDSATYPNDTARWMAAAVQREIGIRFDLSDLQPPAFGSIPEKGMLGILQQFLADPGDVEGTAARLEAARRAAG